MDVAAFKESLAKDRPPRGLGVALEALWWDAKGDWDKAHGCVDDQEDAPGMWVHAYLHRREGDADNAAYWYRRAGKRPSAAPLPQEWDEIARALLAKTGG